MQATATGYSRISRELMRRLNFSRRQGKVPVQGGKETPITSGWVEPHHLYAQVFGHRRDYQPQLAALRRVGLEDPFEERQEITSFVEELFQRYQPGDELGKAILLLRAIMPFDHYFNFNTKKYFGLSCEEGGLDILYEDSINRPLARETAVPLPKHLMAASPNERTANCLEYTFLLVVFLRAAGIEANIKSTINHAYVIAKLNGERYRMDVAHGVFRISKKKITSDRKGLAIYYANKASVLEDQGRERTAMRYNRLALEIDPDCVIALDSAGSILSKRGEIEDALSLFNRALAINDKYADSWNNKGVALSKIGKKEEALFCHKKALEINPDNAEFLNNVGVAYFDLGQLDLVLQHLDRAVVLKPGYASAWNNKGEVLVALGRLSEAETCFRSALKYSPHDPIVLKNLRLLKQRQRVAA